ncbi:MAG: hypothetical protein ACXACX_06535 [Candidatus Hodarchaeales archaeon]
MRVKRRRGVIFITPAKWLLFFSALKNKDVRKIVITLELHFEYLNGVGKFFLYILGGIWDFMLLNNKIKFEIEVNDHTGYSINILKSEEVCQYMNNLSELLPDTYPNVYLQSNSDHYKLWGENKAELLTVFGALVEAFYQADLID